MPIAQLSTGVLLDYRDSGKPQITDVDGAYETLVCVHGVMFNQEIFSPLLTENIPGLRIITYNHRGYRGSSPILPEELIDSHSTRKTYVKDLVNFLEYLGLTLKLPRKPIVLSWERGGNILLGLASPTYLSAEDRTRTIANVSCLILHDCPGNGLGRVPTSDIVKIMIACPYPSPTQHSHCEKQRTGAGRHSQLNREYSRSSTTSSFSTDGGENTEGFYSPSRSERHLSWICGFYKHHNHLPPDIAPYVEPNYSSWAYKCSSELLPRSLIDSAIELENTSQSTLMQSPLFFTPGSVTQFPPNPHLWKLSDDRNQQVEFAKSALVKQRDIPIGLVWNGESPESTVDAAKEGARMGGRVYLLSETGNSLMFAHEPQEWLEGVKRIARDLVYM